MELRHHARLRSRAQTVPSLLLGMLALAGCWAEAQEAADPSSLAPPVALPDSAFRVQWGSATVPKTMRAGRAAPVAVTVRNAGDATWPDVYTGHPAKNGWGAVRLAYRWWRPGSPETLVADYAPADRTELRAPLPPGLTAILTIAVRPPPQPGPYLLQLDLVQEMVSWFEARGTAPLKVPVEVMEAGPEPDVAGTGPAGVMDQGPAARPRALLEPVPPNLSALRSLLSAFAFIAIVPLAFGYVIVGARQYPVGAERMAWTYTIGFAALVFALSAAATFLPARVHGPALATGSAALLLVIKNARTRLSEDIREGWRPLLVVAGIAALGMVALNWPSVASGDTVFFDGHGNHDGFYNVGNAAWLLEHNARDIPKWSVASPLFHSVLDLIGRHSVVTRLGAESLLAAAAATTVHDPLLIYLPLLSALLLPWLATAFLVLRRGWPTLPFPMALAVGIGVFQPLFLFFFANGNFPNLVGLLPCTLLLLLFRWQQTEARPPFGLPAIALATAAPLATYPEALAVTGVGLGVLVLASLGRLPLAGTVRAALGVAAGVALNPLVARRAVGGLRSAMAAGPAMAGGEPWFSKLEPAQFIPAGATLSFHAAVALPVVAALMLSLGILVAIAVGWRRMDDPALGGAVVVPLAAVCALGWHRNMGYAYQKSVQWTALGLCVLLAAGIAECLRPPRTEEGARRRWTVARLGLFAAGATCAVWLVAATVWGMRWMLAVADKKRIDSDFRQVRTMMRELPSGAAVAVRDLPMGKDGFFAMWLPYFIRDRPVFFEWGEAPANYLTVLVRHSARVPLVRAPYVLTVAGSQAAPGEKPILGNRRFWLFAVDGAPPPPDLGRADDVPLSVDGVVAIAAIRDAPALPDGGYTVRAGSKPVLVEGAAFVLDPRSCPREVYLGLADPQGKVVLVVPAERFVRYGFVWTMGFSPEDACGFRARIDPAEVPPGTYYFRAFQLTPDRGFYANPVGDPRLVVQP